jgi:hypothetical protein
MKHEESVVVGKYLPMSSRLSRPSAASSNKYRYQVPQFHEQRKTPAVLETCDATSKFSHEQSLQLNVARCRRRADSVIVAGEAQVQHVAVPPPDAGLGNLSNLTLTGTYRRLWAPLFVR